MREDTDKTRERPPPTLGASSNAGHSHAGHGQGHRPAIGWTEGLNGWLKAGSVAVGMGLFLSLIGALGTNELPLGQRLIYWVPLMVLGTLVAAGVETLTARILRPHLHLNGKPWLYGLILSVLLTPAVTVVVWGFTPLFDQSSPDLASYRRMLLPVGIVCAAMTALNMMVNREPRQSHAFAYAPTPEAPRPIAFIERLPFKHQHAQIYALSAEDHYLRVHTSAGQTLILMRLYDAIRELDGIEGSQTHRSWWVAREAIDDIKKQDGKVCLVLKNGAQAPVSRSYRKALKADGWV